MSEITVGKRSRKTHLKSAIRHFHVTQTLKMQVPNEQVPIEHYLRQPERLVEAITDASRVKHLAPSCFQLRLRSLQFMMLKFEPVTDLQVWTQPDGTLQLRSLNCEVQGADFLNQSFHLELVGTLAPYCRETSTELRGQADLTVQIEIPAPLKLIPEPVLRTSGEAFLNGILLTVKSRLEQKLVQDYRCWAKGQQKTQLSPLATSLGNPC